ncbi:MAG: NFYB/HAP3 family transcription factor subunit [Euryarchaeota archaeon]|nr:NFYB/HAP3 family transcription factor subunit [Euryarchaeota archaeon]
MGELPLTAMDRIIRKASGLRVGLDAREELAKVLGKRGAEIAAEAGKYAKHAKRKTVKAEDIRMVMGR